MNRAKFNPTTCEYVAGEDPLRDCYTPRSCRQCLQQDGCMINTKGMCQAISQTFSTEHDYRAAPGRDMALPTNQSANETVRREIQTWRFPASELDYCDADDAVCKQCTQHNFWRVPHDSGAIVDSRFCVGANGCVCVFNCEQNQALATEICCEPSLTLQADVCHTTSTVHGVEQSLLDADAMRPLLPQFHECRYAFNDSVSHCSEYRSCASCLEKRGCRIGTDGYCEPNLWISSSLSDPYDHRRVSRLDLTLPSALATNPSGLTSRQDWWFPASQATYCPINDTVCQNCTQNGFWMDPGTPADSRFCEGANSGCVCIANCAVLRNASYCPPPVDNRPSGSVGSYDGEYNAFRLMIAIVAVITIAICVGIWCSCLWWRLRRDRKRAQARAGDVATPTVVYVQEYRE